MFKLWIIWLMLVFAGISCVDNSDFVYDAESNVMESHYNTEQAALVIGLDHKLPLSPDYYWGVVQSWGSHCEECDLKYPEGTSYCLDSHKGIYTHYGWDFNLKDDEDKNSIASGKPALASSDGTVKSINNVCKNYDPDGGWGCYVILDHGNNLCTRYAHLIKDSITVSSNQNVCQGMKIGEIGTTGNSSGPHLHFQFEDCKTGIPIARGFGADAKYIPKCLKGLENIKANPLKLENWERKHCGWKNAACTKAIGCPLAKACSNKGKPNFGDSSTFKPREALSINYLWRECAVAGKSDGKFHPKDSLTRAEALKIAMELYGIKCTEVLYEPFKDVKYTDWFYPYVTCGIKKGLITTAGKTSFFPNNYVNYEEAAKFLVEAAVQAGYVTKETSQTGKFGNLSKAAWSYPYLETIFVKGGVSFSLTKNTGLSVTRGEYAIMAASLSPCFEHSVKCSDDCKFNPDTYSCEKVPVKDPEPDPKTGGSSGTDVWSFDATSTPDVYTCKPSCSGKNCGPDGCGGTCGTCSASQICDGSGKCQLKPQNGWVCDPAKGYTLKIKSPGANWKAMMAGASYTMGGQFAPDPKLEDKIKFGCHELPAVVLLNTSTIGKSYVWVDDLTLPKFAEWEYYTDPIMINPSSKPTILTHETGLMPFGMPVLFKMPPVNEQGQQLTPICVPNCWEKNCGTDNCGGNCGICAADQTCNLAGKCESKPQENGWVCDPAQGYSLRIYAPGGTWKAMGSGPVPYVEGKMPDVGYHLNMKFECEDLPGVVLVKTNPDPAYPAASWLPSFALPPYAEWSPYNGPLTINPSTTPTSVNNANTKLLPANTEVLFRVPVP